MNVIGVGAVKVLEYNMEITHLVTSGCSWTYCQGLDDPTTQGWPALIAKELDVPIVNIAAGGSGNDGISRRTIEYFHQNLPTNSRPFFIIGWSQYWRHESWIEKNKNYVIKDFWNISLEEKPSDPLEAAVLEHWSEEGHFRRTLLAKLNLINLFNLYNTPYIMTDFSPSFSDLNPIVKYKVKNRISHIYDIVVNNEKNIKDAYLLAQGYPTTPCGHDGPEAQISIAKYMITEIHRIYPNIKINKSNDFITLNDFIICNGPKNSSVWRK